VIERKIVDPDPGRAALAKLGRPRPRLRRRGQLGVVANLGHQGGQEACADLRVVSGLKQLRVSPGNAGDLPVSHRSQSLPLLCRGLLYARADGLHPRAPLGGPGRPNSVGAEGEPARTAVTPMWGRPVVDFDGKRGHYGRGGFCARCRSLISAVQGHCLRVPRPVRGLRAAVLAARRVEQDRRCTASSASTRLTTAGSLRPKGAKL